MTAKKKYHRVHIDFLCKNKALPRNELCELFNSEFGFNTSKEVLISLLVKHKLTGLTPYGSCRQPMTQPEIDLINSNIYLSTKEIYDIYVQAFGNKRTLSAIASYIRDKNLRGRGRREVYRRIYINGKAMGLHHFVWECVHGPLPDDHCVIFLDGDGSNYSIDNLRSIHKSAAMGAMNRMKGGISSEMKGAIFSVSALRHGIEQNLKSKPLLVGANS